MLYMMSLEEDDKKQDSFLKMVTLLPEEKVLGIHIVSKYADEML